MLQREKTTSDLGLEGGAVEGVDGKGKAGVGEAEGAPE